MANLRPSPDEPPPSGTSARPEPRNRALLKAYRRGDREAAEQLVERTYEAVYASAFKLCGDPVRARDLTQEAYRKAWQSLSGFEGRSSVATWLYRIVYTTFLNSLRTRDREAPLDDQWLQEVPDPALTPEERTDASVAADATRRAVLGLPSHLRDTVAAHYWGDVPVSEIAREAGITPVAVRKRLKKALGLLGSALEETRP